MSKRERERVFRSARARFIRGTKIEKRFCSVEVRERERVRIKRERERVRIKREKKCSNRSEQKYFYGSFSFFKIGTKFG